MDPSAQNERVAELFVRGLGLVLAIAFASLGVQVVGLLGVHGIEPAAELLAYARQGAGSSVALQLPTWLWLTGASDTALRSLCVIGFVCSLLVMIGWRPRFGLIAAWSLYLSLCSVGGVFLSYQWDALLLESALVGYFVATPGLRLGIVLARALCLKLMLLSGLVKLLSGDPTWRNLSALSYHFWTQPLPAWPAVPMSELPHAVLAAMTFAALGIELIAPLAIFGPRRARLVACGALSLLQFAIAATGNYGFFNLLSLVLCASLLDDAALLSLIPSSLGTLWMRRAGTRPERAQRRRVGDIVQHGLALALLSASAIVALNSLLPMPAAMNALVAPLRPLRSVNSYGLFAVMTTERREIAIEGSRDGVTWRRYVFRWKPDALDRRPSFIGPHMPRLDWQMWFAALSSCRRQTWFLAFLQRVLEGDQAVLDLLAHNPFPDRAPRYLRTPSASYHFAPFNAWLHGTWWAREPRRDFCPPVTLRDGELAPAGTLSVPSP